MSAELSAVPAAARLRITETFLSLQGEADAVGWPTFFIRLTGCPLRCHYCDTAYAFHGGKKMSRAEILAEIRKHPARYVTLTGGEPLLQREHGLVALTSEPDAVQSARHARAYSGTSLPASRCSSRYLSMPLMNVLAISGSNWLPEQRSSSLNVTSCGSARR